MLTSDDKVWLVELVKQAIRAIADSCGGDGLIAAHNFTVHRQKNEVELRSKQERRP